MSQNEIAIKKESHLNEIVIGKATDLLELAIAKFVWETLMKHYAGYWWAVSINGGMVQVRNLSLSGDWGFNIHLVKVQEDVSGKLIIAAGGEILERFRVNRGMIKHDEIEVLPIDFAGRIIVDKSGAQNVG
jgi:hypothetical protein